MSIILTPADNAEWLCWRADDITSTRAPALFGASPYHTAYELYHLMRGELPDSPIDGERIFWGTVLEDGIAKGAGQILGVDVAPLKVYARHGEEPRMGSSFDAEITGVWPEDAFAPPSWSKHAEVATLVREAFAKHGAGLLECKNVDALVARGKWDTDPESGEAPLHIEIQVQHQMEVLDREWAVIAMLSGGNTSTFIFRWRDRAFGAQLREKVRTFLALTEPPAPDYARDAETIARLYGYAEPGKVADWRVEAPTRALDLLAEYERLGKVVKDAQEARDAAKAELLTMVGEAEKVQTPLGTLSLPMVGETHVEYTREAYRMFRFTPSKAAKTAKTPTTPTET